MDQRVRVMLVNGQALYRQSLRYLLERQELIEVVGEAASDEEAVSRARDLMPDIVVLDVRVPLCAGTTVIKRMRQGLPGVRVVVLTDSEEDEDLFCAIEAGARAYLLKSIDADELVRAILHVSRGGAVLSPSMAVRLLAEFTVLSTGTEEEGSSESPELTLREQEILELVAHGLTNQEIAERLNIARSTVKTHLSNAMEKLHSRNRSQAVFRAASLTRVRRHNGYPHLTY